MEEWARATIDRHRDDILACVGAARAAVRLEVSDGVASLFLQGDLEGSQEESCIRQAVGTITPPSPNQDVRVVHLLRAD